jgi:glutaredoxin 2
MELKLYHYVHCPYCIRVRMTLGFLELPYQSIVVSYDDEVTPTQLCGKKMLPIMKIGSKVMNESLEIMEELDQDNKLEIGKMANKTQYKIFCDLLVRLGESVHNLAMPYWIFTPEFDESSRKYFLSKKESKRGPFSDLVRRRSEFEDNLLRDLKNIETDLIPFYQSPTFSFFDVLLASHLWGMYVVAEFQFPPQIHDYLQKIKEICHFNYHQDFWK